MYYARRWSVDFNSAPIGKRSRSLACLVAFVGILTFFVPLVTTDTPVADTSRWSAFTIVMKMYEGRLPEPICERCGEPVIRSLLALPFDVSVNYLLLALALLALAFPKAPGFFRTIVFFGSMLDLFDRLKFHSLRWGFEETFYGRMYFSPGPVHYRWLTDLLLIVMVVLFVISIPKELD